MAYQVNSVMKEYASRTTYMRAYRDVCAVTSDVPVSFTHCMCSWLLSHRPRCVDWGGGAQSWGAWDVCKTSNYTHGSYEGHPDVGV